MTCVPSVSVASEQAATPWVEIATAEQLAMAVPLSEKATVPERVVPPAKAGFTVAVNVTDWLTAEGFGDVERVVVVLDWLTVCVRVALLEE